MRWCGVSLILCVTLPFAFVARSHAQSPASSKVRDALIEAQLKAIELQARGTVVDNEIKKLEKSKENDRFFNRKDRRAMGGAIGDTDVAKPLGQSFDKALNEIAAAVPAQGAQTSRALCEQAEDEYRRLERELLGWNNEVKEAEARFGILWPTGRPVAYVDLHIVLIVLAGLLSVAVAAALILHARRRSLRSQRRFRGMMGTVASLLLVASLLGRISTAAAQPNAAPPAGDDAAWIAETRKLAAANLEREGILKRQLEKLAELRKEQTEAIADALRPILGDVPASRLARQMAEEAAKNHDNHVKAQIAHDVDKKAIEKLDELRKNREDLVNLVERDRIVRQWKGGLGVFVGFVLFAGAFLFVRRQRVADAALRSRQSNICPCCLGKNTLVSKEVVQDPRYPEPKYLVCTTEACEFEFPASYTLEPRLSFPTAGVPTSGKTFWLVTAYDMILNDKPMPCTLKHAPSIADQAFDALIQQTLVAHQAPRGTKNERINYPLIFHATDHDAWGKNGSLVNIFDFGGELMGKRVVDDVIRRRALASEGFAYFLDPTQVQAGAKGNAMGTTLSEQKTALSAYYNEMRQSRGLDEGAPIREPIAICISKLDLIERHSPWGSASHAWLEEMRSTFEEPMSLPVLEQRSELCRKSLRMLFPGWDLASALEKNFGDRYMFFPMTPVGLDQLGETNLRKRNFAPVGILEPLIWLLHMHGFKVF
jgi:hypothetical protein